MTFTLTTQPAAATAAPQRDAVRGAVSGDIRGAASRLLLTPGQIAQLARVQRPVVSMWRARFKGKAHEFPEPVSAESSAVRFDGYEVASWLTETGHGNNPDAVADLAAFAGLENIDLSELNHRTVVEALLAHRAVTDADAAGEPAQLEHSAHRADPQDRAFRSEIMQRPAGIDWASYVADLVEGAYSLEGAWHRLQRLSGHRGEAGTAGDLSRAAVDALASIVIALMPPETLDLALAAGQLADAHTVSQILHVAPEDLDVTVAIADPGTDERLPAALAADGRAQARHLARYLLVHGAHANTEPSPASLFIARLRGTDHQAELDDLENLVLDLDEWQSALVLGPDTLLIDPLEGAAETSRDALLRSGRVRAIVRLPAGWVPSAVRQSLALWVIGGSQRDTGIGDRISAVGDLRGPALTPATAAALATDISSVMGSPLLARRHAFRHLRVVRTSTLLAGEGPLDARAPQPTPVAATKAQGTSMARAAQPPPSASTGQGRRVMEYAAHIDAALASAKGPPLTVTVGRAVAPTTVEAQLSRGRLRVLQGARIAHEHCSNVSRSEDASGYPVIGAAEVRSGAASARRIDRMLLVTGYPRAQLTEPGDVIFVSGSRPAAQVDPVGLSVVEYPARILRIVPPRAPTQPLGDAGGETAAAQYVAEQLVPELLAADLAAAVPGSPWRQCALRLVAGEQSEPLSEALATLQRERRQLEEQAANIARAERLLLDGVAAGVAISSQADPNTTDLHQPHTTEGTH